MKILFVIDKIELKHFEFNNLVTNFWLIKEFIHQKQEVFITTIDKLSLRNSKAFSNCSKTFEKNNDIFFEENFTNKPVEDFDLVMFRPDPPVDLNYINATYILDFVDREKTFIMNDTKAIRDFNEKLHANLFVELMPDNIVTSNKLDILEFLEKNEELILKPLHNCFGAGVLFLKKGDKNTNAIINSITNNQTNVVMVQKYIPSAKFGDKRVMILGENIIEECVVKLPSANDFKFNTHSDEFIKKAILSESEKQKFKILAKKLNELGIYMAGLDVIDEQIIEVNVTSPCYFIKEINNYFSISLEKQMVDFILGLVRSKMTHLQFAQSKHI